MIRINVNLNELDELHTTLVSTHDKMTATNNQIYTNLSKLNTMWNDPNTPVFLNQLIVDKEEIDNYTQNTKKTCDTILEFTNDLVNIAIRCNCTTNSNFTYNSDNINYLINYCNSTQRLIDKAVNQLSSMDIPGSFRYASALHNMRSKLSDMNNSLITDINDLNEVTHLTNAAYNKIKSFPVSEPLILKPITYTSSLQNIELVSSKSIVDDSIAKQNLNANISNVEYKEGPTNFNNTSVNQVAGNKTTNYDEHTNTFINAVNQKTASGSLTIDEPKMTFQNTSVNQTASQNQNNFEAEKTNFQNQSAPQTANAVENNFETNNQSISKSSKQTAGQSNINIENTNYNINNSQSQTANNSNNNFQMSNNYSVNTSKEAQTNSADMPFSDQPINLNTSKEYSASNSNLDFNMNNNFENTSKTYDATNSNINFNTNNQFENTSKEFNIDDINSNL